jgi:hypothetical protein
MKAQENKIIIGLNEELVISKEMVAYCKVYSCDFSRLIDSMGGLFRPRFLSR